VVAALAFAQGAMDLALPVSWASSVEIGGPYGATAAAFMNTASSISAALSPVSAAWLATHFGSFRGMFVAVAAVYLAAAVLWLYIDPEQPLIRESPPRPPFQSK
jgi:MFS family permease